MCAHPWHLATNHLFVSFFPTFDIYIWNLFDLIFLQILAVNINIVAFCIVSNILDRWINTFFNTKVISNAYPINTIELKKKATPTVIYGDNYLFLLLFFVQFWAL